MRNAQLLKKNAPNDMIQHSAQSLAQSASLIARILWLQTTVVQVLRKKESNRTGFKEICTTPHCPRSY